MKFALPADLLHDIFQDWILTKDLVRLDSACSRGVRETFLSLIRHPTFVLPNAGYLPRNVNISEAVSWINSRAVKLKSLCIRQTAMYSCAQINRASLSTVQRLEVREDCDHLEVDVDHLHALMKVLPGLTSLDLTGVHHDFDAHLAVMALFPELKLKRIGFDGRINSTATPQYLDELVHTFGIDIETINLGARPLAPSALQHICTKCARASSVSFSCAELTLDAFLNFLASDYLPKLEDLSVFDMTVILDDTALVEVAKHHPKLLGVSITRAYDDEDSAGFSLMSLVILSLCPDMMFLDTPAFRCIHGDFCIKESTGSTMSLLPVEAHALSLLNCPLSSLDFQSVTVSSESFEYLLSYLSTFGAALSKLHIGLEDIVDDAQFSRLAGACSQLKILSLGTCELTDGGLAAIADHCSCLTHLVLWAGLGRFTTLSWCYLFRSLGNTLISVSLLGYNLSAEVLTVIAENCPNLTELLINDSSYMQYGIEINRFVFPSPFPCLGKFEVGRILWGQWRQDARFLERWDRILICM